VDIFTNGPLTFHVRDEGSGPAVLLLHGFPQDARCWDGVVPLLHAAGLRTLRFDQRGYPATARPNRSRDYASNRLVSDVFALLDAAGLEHVHLVGHDLGALVGWATAAAHPERLASLTVLSVPHPKAFLWSLLTSTQAARSWYAGAFQVPGLAERILGQSALVRRFLAVSNAPEAVVERAVELLADPARRHAMLQWYRALAGVPSPASQAACTVPTTFLWSSGDVALSRRGAELTGRYVDAPYRFEVLEGVSHWLPEQVPGVVADLVTDRVLHGR